MNNSKLNRGFSIAFLVSACAVAGCGGTKVLKEPQPIQTTQPLAAISDQRVAATLDWVIVRDGPGTWAKNADWDEYLLRVRNLSDQPIQVTRLIVVDSLNTRIESQPGRKQLVESSKEIARRYKESGVKVKAGQGAGTMLVAGAAVTVVGVGAAYGAAGATVMSGAAVGAGASAAVGGLLLLGPALAVGGIVRGVNNSAVNKEIVLRQTELPIELSAGEELQLDVFFPLAPSPDMVEVTYTDATGEHGLIIDTSTALNGLHIDVPISRLTLTRCRYIPELPRFLDKDINGRLQLTMANPTKVRDVTVRVRTSSATPLPSRLLGSAEASSAASTSRATIWRGSCDTIICGSA